MLEVKRLIKHTNSKKHYFGFDSQKRQSDLRSDLEIVMVTKCLTGAASTHLNIQKDR